MKTKPEKLLDNKVTLHCGDMTKVLPTLKANSIDSVCTDPPYHLLATCKRFGKSDPAKEKYAMSRKSPQFATLSRGFMGQRWDGGDVAFRKETWAEVYRVLKPGGYLIAMGGTRTYHRLACAIEDAGFEIRDCILWLYGSGFPKSHNTALAIDRKKGVKPRGRAFNMKGRGERAEEFDTNGREFLPDYKATTKEAKEWEGWGTALKPSYEPCILARKPLEGSVAENVLKYGTGALNIDASRIPINEAVDDKRLGGKGDWSSDKMAKNVYAGGYAGARVGSSPKGRWPSNVIHDGSEEVVSRFPDSAVSGSARNDRPAVYNEDRVGVTSFDAAKGSGTLHNDSGSAARFFYSPKADLDDRLGSRHPTVKPLDLMRYLVKLITPPKGVVLDCFAGSGTTGEAAWREGFSAVLIEMDKEYQADLRLRMKTAKDYYAREIAKRRNQKREATGLLRLA